MDLSLRDALGGVGGGGGVPGGAPGESLLKRDFMASLEKDSYDDKVGERVAKSDYRPLVDGKDTKSGLGSMSSMMSVGGRQDPPGQPPFSSDYLSGYSQSAMGGANLGMGGGMGMGSGLPPFQSSMSSGLGQSGMSSAMDAQKNSGLFGLEPKTTSNTSGSSPLKSSNPFSSGGSGVHSMDHPTAPALSPSGSMDDSSPTSSTSEPLSPEKQGPGGEPAKQRRRKKKKRGRDEVYNFLDRQEVENNVSQSDGCGMISPTSSHDRAGGQEEEEEEESWEWEIRGRGGGGRVKGKKNKSRMRLPEEWGAPQQSVSPTPATVASNLAAATDSKVLEIDLQPSANPALSSTHSPAPTNLTNAAHSTYTMESSSRSYEPMCVDDFSVSAAKDIEMTNDAKECLVPSEAVVSSAANVGAKTSLPADVSSSLALMSGDNLSPVSQTFSFLDSVLQTPPASTPGSQTTTPITTTPSLATAPPTKTTPSEITPLSSQTSFALNPTSPPSKSPSDLTPTTSTSLFTTADTHISETAVSSSLNPEARPFVPSGAHISSATPSKSEATSPAPSVTPAFDAAIPVKSTVTPPPSITPAAPSSPPAHSEHQESSLPPLPLLEVKSDNKDKIDNMSNKTEKTDTSHKKEKEKEKEEQQKKADNSQDKTQKSEKILKDEEKTEKSNEEKNNKANEKMEKVDKPEKVDKDERKDEEKKMSEKMGEKEKGGKGTAKSPTTSSSKDLASPDSKNKPDVGSTKSNSAKSRPSTLSTNGEASSAKRPSPTTTSANKKSPVTKATTPTTAKQSPAATGPAKAAKTPENGTTEKRPTVPKATPTPRAATNKNGSSANAASKTAATKTDKAENKTGETQKKPTTRPRPRPASTTTPTPQGATTNGDTPAAHRRRTITKPPVPKQTPMEKKPSVPRAPRNARPINAPTPDLKNVRSKIGSTDNIKYQPGGGKVSSTQNNKASDPSNPTAKARVQIVHKKLDFSHVTSRCGSKDNIKHVPGGGNVQILNKKVDLSKVTSKCGSKDNIKHKPGGGDVKIESHKINIKAKSKIGSMDNVGQETGSGHANGHKEDKAEEKTRSPPSETPTPGKAAAPASVAKENGVKEPTPTPFGGDGLREPLSLEKRIPETN
ncbi:microtubule-associated protein 4-like [Lampris incognitus]|uniref:microtubule-associated protein 4-like n=1 Tax=Lampris incognitus TaxID=2546036 RepID=UPI0024B5FC57|nr:microtubule-associated protein 4-like [Lampris incognitus]